MRSKRGFSLLETVIALGIFATIGVAFLAAITTSTKGVLAAIPSQPNRGDFRGGAGYAHES